jgi:ankyrin repeat protein
VEGLGGTLVMMAAAYGEVELLLLSQSDKVININTQTSRGWTALHFAAVCFNPGGGDDDDKQLQVVQMLLDARCDPNIINSFQKTPLEEFVINAHSSSSQAALRLLFTATAGAREKVQAFLRDDGDTSRCWSSADMVARQMMMMREIEVVLRMA